MGILLRSTTIAGETGAHSPQRRHSNQIRPRLLMVASGPPTVQHRADDKDKLSSRQFPALAQPGAAAALAFHHLVTLLQQTLALAILALLLLLDVGAFLAGHGILRSDAIAPTIMIEAQLLVYKHCHD
jgi:hypothetical protein